MRLKTLSFDALKIISQECKCKNLTTVWTNGCFDIMHAGHIKYLRRAANAGDVLIVGLNTDESVVKNKGPGRPIMNQEDRALVLSSLEFVDYILLWDGKDFDEVLRGLKPNYYVKGGDYTIDTVVQTERKIVENYGGKILLFSGVEGISTTEIITKIRKGSNE